MEIFRDLYIYGGQEQIAAVMTEVERSLSDGWARDSDAEARMQSIDPNGRSIYCFSCTREAGRPPAMVFVAEKEPGLYHVSNVVPQQQHQLSYREYNAILEEFGERLVRPIAERSGLRIELTATQADLSRWLSAEAADRLRRFTALANKSTGASHPSDRERWNDFVLAAHRDRSDLDASTLRRWLIEVEGWPPEVADQLAVEYEYGRELLAFSEGRRSA
jgi:hypothetical protein